MHTYLHIESESERERERNGNHCQVKKAAPKAPLRSENWGMGLLLVFFPEDSATTTTATTTPPPSPPLKSPSTPINTTPTRSKTPTPIKRSNSNHPIITKTQSTISICLLSLFLTLLLFTLSNFEPTTTTASSSASGTRPPRRFLSQSPPRRNQNTLKWFTSADYKRDSSRENNVKLESFALQGMGKLYIRGTRAMSDLVVCHVVEGMKELDFRLFLRVLYRSGLTSRADVVLLFSSSSAATRFNSLIQEENESFFKLFQYYKDRLGSNSTNRDSDGLIPSFDVTRFLKVAKNVTGEPLWGRRIPASSSNTPTSNVAENGTDPAVTRLTHGSVVGFDASELDPENSLAGFLDHVPMSLRRWACYPMLLGRVRRNFKHIMLIDPKKLIVLTDPPGQERNHGILDSVFVKQEVISITAGKSEKRNSEKSDQLDSKFNSAILMGGARGIRRFSSAMLTEIVRDAMQHKKKNSVTEHGVLSQLVANQPMLKNVDLIISTEPIPDVTTSSLTGSSSNSSSLTNHGLIRRGNSNHDHDLTTSFIMKQVCSCEIESSVYSNC